MNSEERSNEERAEAVERERDDAKDEAAMAWRANSSSIESAQLFERDLVAALARIAAVEALADKWERDAGPESKAWAVFGPQNVSVPFAVEQIRAAVAALAASPTPTGPEPVSSERLDYYDGPATPTEPTERDTVTAREQAIEAAAEAIWDEAGPECIDDDSADALAQVALAAALPVLLNDLADRIDGIPLKTEHSGGLASAGGMRVCASAVVRAAAEGWGQ